MGEEIYKAKFTADTTELTKAAKDAESKMSKFTSAVDKHSRRLVAAGAAITVGMGAIIAKTVSAAASIEEMQSRMRVTFRDSTKAVQLWASEHAKAVGRSRFAMERMATDMGSLLAAFGFSRDEIAKNSIALTELAVDWESFRDLPMAEVIAKIASGLSGEAEALRRVGVDVTAVALKQELLNQGITTGIDKVDQLTKVKGRLSLILKGLPDAQGDAERTAGSLTNQWRAMQGALEELNIDLGQTFFKDAKTVTTAMKDLILETSRWVRENRGAIRTIGTFGIRLGITMIAMGTLGIAIVKLKALVIALKVATLSAAGALGGVALAAVTFDQKVSILTKKQLEFGSKILRSAKKAEQLKKALAMEKEVVSLVESQKQLGAVLTSVNDELAGHLANLKGISDTLSDLQDKYSDLTSAIDDFGSATEQALAELDLAQIEDPMARFEERFTQIRQSIGALLPEVREGSTEAIGAVGSMLQELLTNADAYADQVGALAAEAFQDQFMLAAGAEQVAAQAAQEALDEIKNFATEVQAATELSGEEAKASIEKNMQTLEERADDVSGRVSDIRLELKDMPMSIDTSAADQALTNIRRQLGEIQGLMNPGAGVGAGTSGEDRLSTSRRPRHAGRQESITTNVNATISIARGGTPSSLAKSVASEIGRMKRRGHRVG